MGAHTQCTHDATCGEGKTGKLPCEQTEENMKIGGRLTPERIYRQTVNGGMMYAARR